MGIVLALLILALGLTLLFGGYRLARFIIPFWGFVSGLSVGGAIMSDLTGAPFLGAFLGLGVGFFLGLTLAVLAYLYYSAAVIVLAGLLGYWIGSSAMMLIGLDPGFLSTFIGSITGVIFGALALVANAPKYVLVTLTSFAGAVTTVSSFLVLFGEVSAEEFNYAATQAAISNSWIWLLMTLVLTLLGMIIQAQLTGSYNLERWAAGRRRRDHHTPTPTTPITGIS